MNTETRIKKMQYLLEDQKLADFFWFHVRIDNMLKNEKFETVNQVIEILKGEHERKSKSYGIVERFRTGASFFLVIPNFGRKSLYKLIEELTLFAIIQNGAKQVGGDSEKIRSVAELEAEIALLKKTAQDNKELVSYYKVQLREAGNALASAKGLEALAEEQLTEISNKYQGLKEAFEILALSAKKK